MRELSLKFDVRRRSGVNQQQHLFVPVPKVRNKLLNIGILGISMKLGSFEKCWRILDGISGNR